MKQTHRLSLSKQKFALERSRRQHMLSLIRHDHSYSSTSPCRPCSPAENLDLSDDNNNDCECDFNQLEVETEIEVETEGNEPDYDYSCREQMPFGHFRCIVELDSLPLWQNNLTAVTVLTYIIKINIRSSIIAYKKCIKFCYVNLSIKVKHA